MQECDAVRIALEALLSLPGIPESLCPTDSSQYLQQIMTVPFWKCSLVRFVNFNFHCLWDFIDILALAKIYNSPISFQPFCLSERKKIGHVSFSQEKKKIEAKLLAFLPLQIICFQPISEEPLFFSIGLSGFIFKIYVKEKSVHDSPVLVIKQDLAHTPQFANPFLHLLSFLKFLICFQGETNAQMSKMTEELSGKSDELIRYQEEISSLLSQIVDLQHKLKEVSPFIHSTDVC